MADMSDSKRKEIETRKRLGRRTPKSEPLHAQYAPPTTGGPRKRGRAFSPPTRDSG